VHAWTFVTGTWEIQVTPGRKGTSGRSGKAQRQAPDTYVTGKSDDCVVPSRPVNEAAQAVEESVEGRRSAKGNDVRTAAPRTQRRTRASIRIVRVRGTGAIRHLRHHPRQEPCALCREPRYVLRPGRVLRIAA
jgi:hypothetical protein